MGLDDVIKENGKWPPPKYGGPIREAAKYNRLFENQITTLRMWIKEVRQKEYPAKEFVAFPAPEIAARTLASFLFGEDASIESDTQPDLILELIEANQLHALNQESAVTCPVEGEVYYKVDWDEDISNRAIVSVVSSEVAIPVFKFKRLQEIGFVESFKDDQDDHSGKAEVWRHVECRYKGTIVHKLFKGTDSEIGRKVALAERDETKDLEEEVATDVDDLLVRHVPFWRTARDPRGISIFRGKEGLISAIHALYSQDQHDAEMAKRRIAASEEYLKKDEKGRPIFDRDLDLFILDSSAAGALGADNKPIHSVEFSDSTVMGQRIAQRFDEFLLSCGIAPQSAGRDVAGAAESGTARKLAQSLTLQTVASAARYFRPAIKEIVDMASLVTHLHLDSSFDSWDDTKVELADGFVDDIKEQSERIQTLRGAKAMSIWSGVVELHPDWDDDAIQEEVDRIMEEEGLNMPEPLDQEAPEEADVEMTEEDAIPRMR